MNIADLLAAARRRLFVGRDTEINLFKQALSAQVPDIILLHIYGPGGQGKTTLVKQLMDCCGQLNAKAFIIDARELNPDPAGFLEAVKNAIGRVPGPANIETNVFEVLKQLPGRNVLFVDTYEKIAPIDDWLRTDFLPRLPANILTVITSRNPPAYGWMTDAGWKALMRIVPLQTFTVQETEDYLRSRNIPENKVGPIRDFTHGHPLALSVVADIYEQNPDKDFNPDESPDVVHMLLQLFVRQTPSPMHRAALEVCALVNLLTESLLSEVMGVEDASELFNWMCGLSFISIGKEGIYPHDIAREALCADLKWRHPDWNAELHNRIRYYYHRKLKESGKDSQKKVLFDLIYLHRLNPVVKPFFDWREGGSYWVDVAFPDDVPAIREMVERLEGATSLSAFDFWQGRPMAQIWVWRNAQKKPAAFILRVNTHELTPEQASGDPVIQKVIEYQQKKLNLRSGEQVALFRFWMAHDTGQQISALQSSMFLTIVQYYFTPGLAASMISVAQPAFWKPVLSYADLSQIEELDFEVHGVPYGWYFHDWRIRPPLAWLDLMGRREINADVGTEAENKQLQAVVLQESEFTEGVSEALRNLHNNNLLQNNVLMRSKIIIEITEGDPSDAHRVAALKQKILDTMALIESSPIDGKFHRVLYRTFVNPVGSQEKTADFLNMSFSTYRRYLQAGSQRLAEILWGEEV